MLGKLSLAVFMAAGLRASASCLTLLEGAEQPKAYSERSTATSSSIIASRTSDILSRFEILLDLARVIQKILLCNFP